MRNVKKILVAATAIAGMATSTNAFAIAFNMPVAATVLAPVTTTPVQSLNFGTIIAGTAGVGVITVTAGTAPAGANSPGALPAVPVLAYYTSQRSGAGGTAFGLSGQVYGTATNCSATVICNPGVVRIEGSPASTIATVTMPAANVTLAGGTGTAPFLAFATITRNPAAALPALAAGTNLSYIFMNVGGALSVDTSTRGAWTGNIPITVDY
jgi:hypothetical protein